MDPPRTILETNEVINLARSAMREMDTFRPVDPQPAVDPPSNVVGRVSLGDLFWKRVRMWTEQMRTTYQQFNGINNFSVNAIQMTSIINRNNEIPLGEQQNEEQEGLMEEYRNDEENEDGIAMSHTRSSTPSGLESAGATHTTPPPTSPQEISLHFLHRMLDVQEQLLLWLTKLTSLEISIERYRPSPIELDCIKTISVFHHKLLPIVEYVYACQFRDWKPYDVFICHAGPDKDPYARPLAHHLEAIGNRVFIDAESITLGRTRPTDEMIWALTTAKVFWCVASPTSVQAWYPMRELQFAYVRYVQAQQTRMNFQLIMDCHVAQQHTQDWGNDNMNWMDYILTEVQSLKIYGIQTGSQECVVHEFPCMKRAGPELESFDQRVARIAQDCLETPGRRRQRRRKTAVFSASLLVLVFLAAVMLDKLGTLTPYEPTRGHPSSTSPGGQESDESSGHNKGSTCNKGGTPPSSIFPERPSAFFGRNIEMKTLTDLHSPNSMLAIVGGAGVGKTHLAAHYANDWFQKDKSKRRVYWLEAASVDDIRPDYIALLQRFGCWPIVALQGDHAISDLAELVWKQLGMIPSTFEWMVVFNNAPEVMGDKEGPSTLESYFFGPRPLRQWSQGTIFFTTRSRGYNGKTSLGDISRFLLDPPDGDAAMEMLLKDTTGNTEESSREAAREVVRRFGNLPLAIVTANSVIKHKDETVKDYFENMGDAKDVEEAIADALKNALDYADQVGLGYVLDVVSFINPDQISLSLLQNRTDDVHLLSKLSVLKRVGEGVYSMHRMHQEAAREGRSALNALNVVFNEFKRFNYEQYETWSAALKLVPHAVALEARTPTKPFLRDLFYPLSEILHKSGIVLNRLHDFEQSLTFYERSIKMKRKLYGPGAKNDDLASTLTGFGAAQDLVSNYAEARSCFVEALEMYHEMYGLDAKNASLALTLNNFGVLDQHAGHQKDARSKFEEALEMYRHVYGADAANKDMAKCLNNLGKSEKELRNYDSAASYFAEALEMYRRVYDGDTKNLDIATILNNIGSVELDRGNFAKARSCFMEALDMYHEIYGDDAKNVNVARLLTDIGMLEKESGNYTSARSELEEAMEIYHQVYNDDANEEMAITLHNLGMLEKEVGNCEKSRWYFGESLRNYGNGSQAKSTKFYLKLLKCKD